MPARRYQTPSRVRHTSSASILLPLVKRMTGLPPSFLPIPGPLVETGVTVVRVCEVAVRSETGFSTGVAEGEGEAFSTGAGETIWGSGSAATGVTVTLAVDCASATL